MLVVRGIILFFCLLCVSLEAAKLPTLKQCAIIVAAVFYPAFKYPSGENDPTEVLSQEARNELNSWYARWSYDEQGEYSVGYIAAISLFKDLSAEAIDVLLLKNPYEGFSNLGQLKNRWKKLGFDYKKHPALQAYYQVLVGASRRDFSRVQRQLFADLKIIEKFSVQQKSEMESEIKRETYFSRTLKLRQEQYPKLKHFFEIKLESETAKLPNGMRRLYQKRAGQLILWIPAHQVFHEGGRVNWNLVKLNANHRPEGLYLKGDLLPNGYFSLNANQLEKAIAYYQNHGDLLPVIIAPEGGKYYTRDYFDFLEFFTDWPKVQGWDEWPIYLQDEVVNELEMNERALRQGLSVEFDTQKELFEHFFDAYYPDFISIGGYSKIIDP